MRPVLPAMPAAELIAADIDQTPAPPLYSVPRQCIDGAAY
ncbi:hypothetical protein JSE7799_01955 [Jannaschia seosinensis]|uniref:Uncharacterized protein n=1 Tax=Jannaschia seosinensis TaxID=313367 RepID=A0A0M7BBP3_9RHOB|nr:hypothetical protein JSE7799_01955 [Jannaschia seosinensis]